MNFMKLALKLIPVPRDTKAERAAEALAAIERLYLRAHGWEDIGLDYWKPPKNHPSKNKFPHRTGHAVNSQKWANAWSR